MAAGIDAEFVLFAGSLVFDAEMAAMIKGYAGRVMQAMAPWSNPGHYLNFAEHKVDTAETYGGTAHNRLMAIKARMDPENAIHANHEL